MVIEESAGKDTVIVTKFGYYIPSDSSRGILGDSLIMKKYKGYYFFNEKSNSAWLLRVLKKEKNGDLSFMLIEPAEKSFDEFLLTLNEQIRIDSIDVSGGTLYQISPSPNKLVDLIERGFFKTSITLRKLR